MAIHRFAEVDPSAQIHPSAVIGPFCVITGKAVIGEGVELVSHVTVLGRTTIGAHTKVFPGAVIGGDPQDVKFKGEDSETVIGSHCRIHECATVNKGTEGGGMRTAMGDRCLIMAYAHLGHDTILADQVIVGNAVQIAGHCHIGRKAIINGLCGIHQFTSIGELSYVGAMCPVTLDIPPYMIADGDPVEARNVNVIGLRRDGFAESAIDAVRSAFRAIFRDPENRPVGVCAAEFLDGLQGDADAPAVKLAWWLKERAEKAKKGRLLESDRPAIVGARPNQAKSDGGNLG